MILHHKDGGVMRIDSIHRIYDALHYVLLLPEGQDGFTKHLTNSKGKAVSIRQFYAYNLQVQYNQ